MTLQNKGIPALVVTCAFAMFSIAAIPIQAKAYYNGSEAEYNAMSKDSLRTLNIE